VQNQLQTQAPNSNYFPTTSIQPPLAIILHLARRIDDVRHSQARACVLWLVGQFSEAESKESGGGVAVGPEGIAGWAPDVLRKVAKTFSQEVCSVYNVLITLILANLRCRLLK
jgi:AP-3 complex subunit beta